MGITMDTKPWNKYRGMTTGDMLSELVEMDYHQHGVDPVWGREHFLENYTEEQIREFWWYEIGRHNHEY